MDGLIELVECFSLDDKTKKMFCAFFLHIYRLAVHNMHYVSNVLGIRDPIHKQKIALKAMDVVLFGPPRGTYFCQIIFSLSCKWCRNSLRQNCVRFVIHRDWNSLERLYTSDIIIKCNYRLLVRLSAK